MNSEEKHGVFLSKKTGAGSGYGGEFTYGVTGFKPNMKSFLIEHYGGDESYAADNHPEIFDK
jgi:hypothetical protein